MKQPILSTKLKVPPPRSDLVLRNRLYERLVSLRETRLLLVCAPAGFGKTTLLSSWIRNQSRPVAWISLDPDDNSLKRFLVYLTAAVQAIHPNLGTEAQSFLLAGQPMFLQSAITTWINELSEFGEHIVLCLDDYHLIEDQEVHTAVNYLLEHAPDTLHLVISTRSDPPLQLSRLRARNQLCEIRQADLRFTPNETGEFLQQSAGVHLTNAQIDHLDARTGGWAAGIQFAALSLRSTDDADTFLRDFSGSNRYIIDYLAEEVYSRQPEDVRAFIHAVSILDPFCAALCDFVTGRRDSSEQLRTLEQDNLFLMPLDDAREWYRFHPLFRDFLHNTLADEQKETLHRQAARWFANEGRYPQALKHAISAGDTATTRQILEKTAFDMLRHAEVKPLLSFLKALPPEQLCANPTLILARSFAFLLLGSAQEAITFLTGADNLTEQDLKPSLEGIYLCLQAQVALCDNRMEDCIRLSEEALTRLAPGDQFFRGLSMNTLGQVCELTGDFQAAAHHFRQAFEASWAAGDHVSAWIVFTSLVFNLNELGLRNTAERLCSRVLTDASKSDQEIPLLDVIYLSWSLLELEAGRLETARQYVNRALHTLENASFSQGVIWGLYILSRILLAEGKIDEAVTRIYEGKNLTARTGRQHHQGILFEAASGRAYLAGGQIEQAGLWADQNGLSSRDIPKHHTQETLHITFARVLIAQGAYTDADKILRRIETSAAAGSRNRTRITVNLLRSLCAKKSGRTTEAPGFIRTALELAAPEEYLLPFLEEGPEVRALIPNEFQPSPGFIQKIRAIDLHHGPQGQIQGGPINPLTDRECEILQMVAVGHSNAEIAEHLVITLGTVKKHLNNIFGKLYVSNRTEAVARGRTIGYLE